eukprot:2823629-Pleurochrysis_carterae.AAC.1
MAAAASPREEALVGAWCLGSGRFARWPVAERDPVNGGVGTRGEMNRSRVAVKVGKVHTAEELEHRQSCARRIRQTCVIFAPRSRPLLAAADRQVLPAKPKKRQIIDIKRPVAECMRRIFSQRRHAANLA